MNGKETSNYPNIKWKDDKRTFYYKIIKAGTYPQESMLYQTQRLHSYPIPHGLIYSSNDLEAKYMYSSMLNKLY